MTQFGYDELRLSDEIGVVPVEGLGVVLALLALAILIGAAMYLGTKPPESTDQRTARRRKELDQAVQEAEKRAERAERAHQARLHADDRVMNGASWTLTAHGRPKRDFGFLSGNPWVSYAVTIQNDDASEERAFDITAVVYEEALGEIASWRAFSQVLKPGESEVLDLGGRVDWDKEYRISEVRYTVVRRNPNDTWGSEPKT